MKNIKKILIKPCSSCSLEFQELFDRADFKNNDGAFPQWIFYKETLNDFLVDEDINLSVKDELKALAKKMQDQIQFLMFVSA